MSTLEEIERAIDALSETDLRRLRAWFDERDAQLFDDKLARDAATGKLDKLAAKALADFDAGRTRKL